MLAIGQWSDGYFYTECEAFDNFKKQFAEYFLKMSK